MYDCTSNNWSHWNSNEKLKEKVGNCTRKTFDRFTTKDSYTWNITHNTESTAVWSLKPERWGSPLVQEKYRGEKACDKRHPYRTRTTIIIIIIITREIFIISDDKKINSNCIRRNGHIMHKSTASPFYWFTNLRQAYLGLFRLTQKLNKTKFAKLTAAKDTWYCT